MLGYDSFPDGIALRGILLGVNNYPKVIMQGVNNFPGGGVILLQGSNCARGYCQRGSRSRENRNYKT